MVIKYRKEEHEEWKRLNDKLIEKDWQGAWQKSVREYYPEIKYNKDEGWHFSFDRFQNKSAITRNITEPDLPKVSPHWPGIGRYVGVVDDEKPVLFQYEGFNCFDYWDRQPWQKNRIYGDELIKTSLIIGKVYYCKIFNKFVQLRELNYIRQIAICSDYTKFLSDAKTVISSVNKEVSFKFIENNFISFNDPNELSIYGVEKKYEFLSHHTKESKCPANPDTHTASHSPTNKRND